MRVIIIKISHIYSENKANARGILNAAPEVLLLHWL